VNEALSLSEKEGIIKIRLANAKLTLPSDIETLKALNKSLLSKGFDRLIPPEPNTLDVLYRAFRPGSYSRYDMKLGFRASDQPFTLPFNHEGPLHESSLVDEDVFENHCNI
jgi:hypothetical protein